MQNASTGRLIYGRQQMKPEQDIRAGIENNTLSESPLVSVVMCAYNAGEYLRPATLSIIGQTYRNLDIIIIDDGSTDGCFSTVEDLLGDSRVRVFHQANATKPVALNRALDLVRGEFYAIQDADDVSDPRRIEKQVHAMLAQPQLAAVFTGHELLMNGRSMAPMFAPKWEAECKRDIDAFRMPALDPTGMFRMSLVGDLRYEPSLPIVEHLHYILMVGERHPMIVLGECLYGYRILPNSLTRRNSLRRDQREADVLRRACERRGLQYDQVFPRGYRAGWSQNSIMDNNLAAHFMQSVRDQYQADHRWGAVRTGWDCARLHPLDPHYYKALVYALASPRAVDYVRRDIPAFLSELKK
jgi:glycosyltransferase involved in cell wall biosynthesis